MLILVTVCPIASIIHQSKVFLEIALAKQMYCEVFLLYIKEKK